MALDPTILEAALEGLEAQRQRLEEQIREVRSRLGRRGPGRPKSTPDSSPAQESAQSGRKKRKVSAAARKRMAEAQKKRWAAVKKSQG